MDTMNWKGQRFPWRNHCWLVLKKVKHTDGESCGQVELHGVGIIRYMILFKTHMHSIFKMLIDGGFIMFLYFMRKEICMIIYFMKKKERKLEGKNDNWKGNLNMREDKKKMLYLQKRSILISSKIKSSQSQFTIWPQSQFTIYHNIWR